MEALILAFAVLFAPPAPVTNVVPVTIHTVVPVVRAPQFTRQHVAASPVVRHTWEVLDAKGCVTRTLDGDASGMTVTYCKK